MRRFGSSGARDRATAVIRGLSEDDASAKLAALNQLCDMINTGTEDTLASLRPDSTLPPVVAIMTSSANPDMVLLATRVLTYYIDAIQGSSNAVAGCGGIDALTGMLLEIRDIELAEQALVALDKIALENPSILLQTRGPEAFLLFVDFFGIATQRKAVSAVANLARRATPGSFHRFVPILQQLRNMILHEDERLSESALQALSRIVQGVQADATKVQAVLEDAIPAFVEVLEGRHAALAAKVLAEGAQSPKVAGTLVDHGIVTVVAKLLGGALVRATPAPTPQMTPQHGATTAAAATAVAIDGSPLSLDAPALQLPGQDSGAASPIGGGAAPAAASSGSSPQQQQQQQQQQLRPETALDLITIVLRLLPEVHSDYMLYMTEGCRFFEQRPGGGGGSGAGAGDDARNAALRRMLDLPPGMPPELQETFRRMLEATGAAQALADDDGSGPPEDDEGMFDDDDEDDEHDDDEDEEDHHHEEDEDEDDGDDEEHQQSSSSRASSDARNHHTTADSGASGAGAGASGSGDRRSNSRSSSSGGEAATTSSARNPVMELAQRAGVTIATDQRWAACRQGRHSCDQCSKTSLGWSDWFRSNERGDYDLCRSCLMRSMRGRTMRRHGTTFTDMSQFGPKPRHVPPPPPLTRPVDPRVALLAESPYILPRVAEGMNAIVKYRMGSEDTTLHARVLDLICRVVQSLDGTEIKHFFFDVPLTTIIAKTLSTSNEQTLGQHVVSLYICKLLLEKMSKTIVPYFARNGVSRALSVRAAAAETTSQPIQQQLATLKGRRTFVANLARSLNQEHFADAPGSAAFDAFANAAKNLLLAKKAKAEGKLDAGDDAAWKDAAAQLVARFGASQGDEGVLPIVSAHEMDDSGMLEALVSWLQQWVNAAATTTTTQTDGGSSNNGDDASSSDGDAAMMNGVLQFVQLVASLFQATVNPQQGGMNQQLTPPQSPSLSPHSPDSAAPLSSSSPASPVRGDGLQTALHRLVAVLQDIVADCEQFDPANVRIRRGRDGFELKLTREGPPPPSSSAGSSDRPPAPTDIKVSIDRQATVGAIEDYLRGNVFHVPRRGGGSPSAGGDSNTNDNEDAVEELLPQTSADASSPTRRVTQQSSSSSSPVRGAQPVYMRCGSHLLASGLSMNDVVAKYLPDYDAKAPLHFHFSLEPFSNLSQDAAAGSSSSSSSSSSPSSSSRPIYDTSTKHRIFLEFKRALTGKLHIDTMSNVSFTVIRAMRLLRVIHAVNAHLDSLRCFVRVHNNNPTELAQGVVFAAGNDESGPGIRFHASDGRSRRLTAKIEKVFNSSSCVGSLRDSWCTAIALDCPFLIPLETRIVMLELGFLGTARGAARHAERAGNPQTPLSFLTRGGAPRVSRKKFRVWRDAKLLDCAVELFKRGPDGGTESVLEFEFYGEVGSGLGPTLEFYSLACEALQQRARGLFRSDDDDQDLCTSQNGLFLGLNGSEAQARTLGSLLARSLMDRRVANIYLSSALVRLLKGETLVFDDISAVLPTAARNSLLDIYAAGSPTRAGHIDDKASVEDLCLAFELPFQPKGAKPVELKPDGSNVDVTATNAQEYVSLVVSRLLADDTVRGLVGEVRVPLISIFDARALKFFEPYELSSIWKGLDKKTSLQEFQQYTTFDHGYTATHPTAKVLLEVLGEMSAEEQRAFFRFLTGSPALPVGGLAALRPKFTVVRRLGENEQQQLPSAMTCQNFLKLPAYDSKEVLREKLIRAMNDGAGAFLFT